MSTLKHRSFTWLVGGQFISTIGDNFYVLAIYWYVLKLTHSHVDVLLIGLAQTVPVVGSLFWGVWIDRWNKRTVMIVSDWARFGVAGLLAAFTLSVARPPVVILFILVFVLRTLGTFFNPAASSLMPQLVPSDQLNDASGISKALTGGASLIGVALGGVLMMWMGPPLLFALDAGTFIVSVVTLLFVKPAEPIGTDSGARESFFESWRIGYAVLWRSLWMRRLLVVAGLLNLVLVPLEMVLPQWVHGPLHGNASALGWLNAVFLLGYVGGALSTPWTQRRSAAAVLGMSMAVLGALTAGFGQAVVMPWPYIVAGTIGITMGIIESTVTGVMMRAIPERYRGRVWSSFSGFVNLITPLGMAGTELILASWGMPLLFGGIGVLALVVSFSFLIRTPEPTADALESSHAL